jgi:tryptophanyl-tRNA synthetase
VTDTDTGPDAVRYDPVAKPGVSNLLELLGVLQGRPPAEVAADYSQYGPLKADLADAVVALLEPIQESYARWADDPRGVLEVLAAGAKRADAVARETLGRASEAIGLLLPPG